MQRISTIVLTKNEEKNIGRCLQSVQAFSDEMIVVDCFSTDRTVEIAKRFTGNVYQNEWPGFAQQRKFALSKTKNDWVLWIDADEEVSSELAEEIKGLPFDVGGYYLPRLVYYLGRWIRHCGWYPNHTMRLFDKRKGQFSNRRVHESFAVEGRTRRLKHPLFHYPYRDISHHMEKINAYSNLAALQMAERGYRASVFSILTHSVFKFFKMYLLQLGFLDGRQGFIVSVLGSYYVFLKYAKRWEKQYGTKPPD